MAEKNLKIWVKFLAIFVLKSGQKSGHWPEKVGFLLYFSDEVLKSPKMTGQKPTFAKKSGHEKKAKKG